MSGWYYKLFGDQFGPVSLDALIDLAKSHTISADDEVRFGEDGPWRRAGSLGQLMTHLPYQAPKPAMSISANPQETSSLATEDDSMDSQWSSLDDFETSSSVVDAPKVEDRWWCKILDTDVGPLTFEELAEMAKNHTMSRDDQVRFGESGPWRRAGSIGSLMTHFPFEAAQRVITTGKREAQAQAAAETADFTSTIEPIEADESDAPVTPSPAAASPPDLGKSAAVIKTNERWWCLIDEKEYGPVDWDKLIEWAENGRLHSYDHVRSGRNDYVLASDVPGLFPKRPEPVAKSLSSSGYGMRFPASPTRGSDPGMTPPTEPVTSKPGTDPSMSSMADTTPATPVVDRKPFTPSPMSSPGFGSSSSIATRPMAPAAPIRRPTPSKSSGGGFDIVGLLTGPVGIGIGAVLLLGVVGYFGMALFSGPSAADTKRYQDLRMAYDAVCMARNEGGKPPEIKAAAEKMGKVAADVAKELKSSKDPGQKALYQLASKLESLSKEDLVKSKKLEESASSKFKTAALKLKLK